MDSIEAAKVIDLQHWGQTKAKDRNSEFAVMEVQCSNYAPIFGHLARMKDSPTYLTTLTTNLSRLLLRLEAAQGTAPP